MPITATEVEIKFRPTPYNILELSNAAGGVRFAVSDLAGGSDRPDTDRQETRAPAGIPRLMICRRAPARR